MVDQKAVYLARFFCTLGSKGILKEGTLVDIF